MIWNLLDFQMKKILIFQKKLIGKILQKSMKKVIILKLSIFYI